MISLMAVALALQTAPAPPSAAPGSKPVPAGSPQNWVTNDDYPAEALRENMQGVVSFALEIDAQGIVSTCEITGSSGSSVLDMTTCNLLTARARFEPATDAAGKPVASLWRSRFTWRLPAPSLTPMRSWVHVLHFELDAQDQIAKCEVRQFGPPSETAPPCGGVKFPAGVLTFFRERAGGAAAFDMVTVHQVAGTPLPGGFKLPEGISVFDNEVLMTIGADGKVRACEAVRGGMRLNDGAPKDYCASMFTYAPDPRAGDKRQVTYRSALIAQPAAKP